MSLIIIIIIFYSLGHKIIIIIINEIYGIYLPRVKKIIISAALSCTIFGIFDVEEFRNLEI